MSRSVAGFTMFLYVCVVSGQQHSNTRLKGTPNDPSIAIDVISGGSYPAGSFSIGYGNNNANDDGGPGAGHEVNGGNGQFNPNYDSGNQQYHPNTGQGQNEGGYVNGQNDIGSNNGQNGQNGTNNYDVPLQNPGRKPINPYDINKQNNDTPVKNSASKNSIFSRLFNYIFTWFF